MGRSSDDPGDNITPGEQRAHPLSVGPRGRGGGRGVTQAYGDGSLPFLAALGEHAKQHPRRRYRDLYKTMGRMDVLQRAWAQAAANDGAAGIDGIGFASIEKGPGGIDGFLEKLRGDLLTGTYHPLPVRRVNIPKEGKPGQVRALGIPTGAALLE